MNIAAGSITLKSFAKINLSIDVTGIRPDKMHTVDMVMQEISLCDDVTVTVTPASGQPLRISVHTDNVKLPGTQANLAYRAAEAFAEETSLTGANVEIDIKKRIPIAAGLAGGSSNAAAVLHALNALCRTDMSLGELCGIGARLGSDVPFCVEGQAAANENLPPKVREDPDASTCDRATGTGTEMVPVTPLRSALVIAKPDIEVSTAEVYAHIDQQTIPRHPDNDALCAALKAAYTAADSDSSFESALYGQMINVLENYTLYAIPEVMHLKVLMEEHFPNAKKIMMSGSGPTVFALFGDGENAENDASRAQEWLRAMKYEAHAAETLIY
ncbi:MAG: 4-(cytidine 5'-diphospho)-2-C-methyl-D-erythritol kinase [Eubacterium sp.]|jgi:4-diphosphocytidyl-2-C-methyl-D-erythritol kinase